jgi:hypothetical protein
MVKTVSQDIVGLYDFIQLINIGGSYPFGAGRMDPAASLDGMVSYNRTWENTCKQEHWCGCDNVLQ